jgi:hypothetical protein
MTTTDPTTIWCPVCASHDAMLRHDIQASLVYCCHNCLHEWQLDAAEESPDRRRGIADRPVSCEVTSLANSAA